MAREQVSKNFYLDELVYSPTAVRRKIDNSPNVEQAENLRYLIKTILQPIRDHYKKAVKINSGFRSAALNAAVGGSDMSQHSKGEAVDFEIEGIPNKDVAEWVADNLPFDQIILEFYNPMEGVNSGWIHVSTKRNGINRKQKLVAYKDGKKTRYEPAVDFSTIT